MGAVKTTAADLNVPKLHDAANLIRRHSVSLGLIEFNGETYTGDQLADLCVDMLRKSASRKPEDRELASKYLHTITALYEKIEQSKAAAPSLRADNDNPAVRTPIISDTSKKLATTSAIQLVEAAKASFSSVMGASAAVGYGMKATAHTVHAGVSAIAAVRNANPTTQKAMLGAYFGVIAMAGHWTFAPQEKLIEVPIEKAAVDANGAPIEYRTTPPGKFEALRMTFMSHLKNTADLKEDSPFYRGMERYFHQAEAIGKLADPRVTMALLSGETGLNDIKPRYGDAEGFFQHIITTMYADSARYMKETLFYKDLDARVKGGTASSLDTDIKNAIDVELEKYAANSKYAVQVRDTYDQRIEGKTSPTAPLFLSLRNHSVMFEIIALKMAEQHPDMLIDGDPKKNDGKIREFYAKAQAKHFFGDSGAEWFTRALEIMPNEPMNSSRAREILKEIIIHTPSSAYLEKDKKTLKAKSKYFSHDVPSRNNLFEGSDSFAQAYEKILSYLERHVAKHIPALDGYEDVVFAPVLTPTGRQTVYQTVRESRYEEAVRGGQAIIAHMQMRFKL